MKAGWIAAFALGVVAVAIITFVLWPQEEAPLPPETQRLEHNEVTVTATRASAAAGGVPYTVIIETHTVDLSAYDPVEQATLETDRGIDTRPLPASEVVKNDGHHIEARLLFDVAPADAHTLVLHDLAGRAEWRLEFSA